MYCATRASDPNEFIELEGEVRDDTKIYSYDGKTSGPVTDSRVLQACPDVDASEQTADEAARVKTQPAAVTRPKGEAKRRPGTHRHTAQPQSTVE